MVCNISFLRLEMLHITQGEGYMYGIVLPKEKMDDSMQPEHASPCRCDFCR